MAYSNPLKHSVCTQLTKAFHPFWFRKENKDNSHQLQLSVDSNLFKSFTAASNSDLAAGYFSVKAQDTSFQQRSESVLKPALPPELNC